MSDDTLNETKSFKNIKCIGDVEVLFEGCDTEEQINAKKEEIKNELVRYMKSVSSLEMIKDAKKIRDWVIEASQLFIVRANFDLDDWDADNTRSAQEKLVDMKNKTREEKEHPYKLELRRFDELDKAQSVEGLTAAIKEAFRGLVRNGKVNPEMAIITRTLVEGGEKQRLSLALNLLKNCSSAMLWENNIYHLKRMVADRTAANEVLAYGDAIVKSPLPLLWDTTEDARYANTVIMQSALHYVDKKDTTLSGAGAFISPVMEMPPTQTIFKRPSHAIPSSVVKTVNNFTGILKGAGYKVYAGEDGGIVLDDLELAFNSMANTIVAMSAKYETDQQLVSQKMDYLYQQQGQLAMGQQQQQQQLQYQVGPYNNGRGRVGGDNRTCYICGIVGHIARNCRRQGNGGVGGVEGRSSSPSSMGQQGAATPRRSPSASSRKN